MRRKIASRYNKVFRTIKELPAVRFRCAESIIDFLFLRLIQEKLEVKSADEDFLNRNLKRDHARSTRAFEFEEIVQLNDTKNVSMKAPKAFSQKQVHCESEKIPVQSSSHEFLVNKIILSRIYQQTLKSLKIVMELSQNFH